jgi:hypothetical protein
MHHWFSIILLHGKAFPALKWVRLACKYPLELDRIWVQINSCTSGRAFIEPPKISRADILLDLVQKGD